MRKETIVALFKVSFQNLLWGDEKNYENSQGQPALQPGFEPGLFCIWNKSAEHYTEISGTSARKVTVDRKGYKVLPRTLHHYIIKIN
jgi:hypothetical protein